jgi:uncharacterized membrane protein
VTSLIFACAIGAGLVSGIFYAFSAFVMQALRRLTPREGISAMQSINIAVINPWFLLPFFGTGVLCIATIAVALVTNSNDSFTPVLAGSLLYLFMCFGVTVAGNVPLNNSLAKANPGEDEAESLWFRYLASWTRWNHVRTAASLAAAVAFVFALRAA